MCVHGCERVLFGLFMLRMVQELHMFLVCTVKVLLLANYSSNCVSGIMYGLLLPIMS